MVLSAISAQFIIAALLASPNDSPLWLFALAIVGIGGGSFLFFQGFRMLRYKRLLLNTPQAKIRSASIGLVELSGNPTGPKTLTSAITGVPCFYYRARGWKWVNDSGKGGSWQQTVDESVSVPFFLDDGTGKVLVNAQGAKMDVHCSFKDEFGVMSVLGKYSVVPESIRKFIATRGLMAGEKVRLEEYVIQPGYPLFVFGTLGENKLSSWDAQTHFGANKVSINLGDLASVTFGRSASASEVAANALAGIIEQAASGGSQSTTYRWQSSGITATAVVSPRAAVGGPTDSGQQNGQVHTETGNQVAASQSDFDLHTHVAVGKGERGEPFVISSQSQREVVQSLAWKSICCIWGGPILALVCLYCLMAIWG